jgi:hypothetical protein
VAVAQGLFHERVADAFAAGGAAVFEDFLLHDVAAAQVVDDVEPGFFFRKYGTISAVMISQGTVRPFSSTIIRRSASPSKQKPKSAFF